MEDLEDVRRRMQEKKKPKLNQQSFQWFYRFSITTMSCCAFLLVGAVFLKTNTNVDLKQWIEDHVLSVIPFPMLTQEVAVDQMVHYEMIGQNQYTSNDQNIYALEDGIVQEVTHDSISIIYRNGVVATYRQFVESHVKAYDHVQQAESLGTYEQAFEMTLTKDGIDVSYEEVFA